MKLKERTGVKIAAVITSYIAVVFLVLSVISIGVMGYYKFYFSSETVVKEEILTDMAASESNYIVNLMSWGRDLTKYYNDKNLFFVITDANSGEVLQTNYNGEPYMVTASTEHIIYDERYFEADDGDLVYESVEKGRTKIEVYVPKSMTKSDMFSVMAQIIAISYSMRYAMVFIVLISAAATITLLSYLYCAAGHREGGVIMCNAMDKVPFDIMTAMVGVIFTFSIAMLSDMASERALLLIAVFILGTVDYFTALGYTMSFATRVKTGTLFKNTVIYRLLVLIGKGLKKLLRFIKYVISGIPFLYKWILFCILLVPLIIVVTGFDIFVFEYISEALGVLLIIPEAVIALTALIYIISVFGKIKDGGERISAGAVDYKIDTRYMFGDFKHFAESLNNISAGLQNAVQKKMKSERFKTELITNVSHDIKTPLTSIINYVDLIKKEEIKNETAVKYIGVLDRQSSRLKKLVEDLVEASKASTGNLTVNLSECDIGVLLMQTIGEFEERLERSDIKPVLNTPENSVKVMADGRYLWRVFDNLMNNICKYAQPGTRAYLDVYEEGGRVIITFRNISECELNISADELMERFVKGDASRNTEGSGLGLSIARSLVELQGGRMELNIDGDLFKAIIIFSKKQE